MFLVLAQVVIVRSALSRICFFDSQAFQSSRSSLWPTSNAPQLGSVSRFGKLPISMQIIGADSQILQHPRHDSFRLLARAVEESMCNVGPRVQPVQLM